MEIKEGRKTSELWLAVFLQLVALPPLFGVITAEEAETIADAVKTIVMAVMALITSVTPVIAYIKARTELKKAK